MRTLTALFLLCLTAAAAPPPLEIPPELKPVNGYVRLVPKTTAKAVTYVARSGVYPFPSEDLRDPRTFILPVGGLPNGRYKFTAVGSLNDEHAVAEFEVVVGDAPPGPGPGPTPPPGPTDDPLLDPARAAYGGDQSPTKAADKEKLAAAYRALAAPGRGVNAADVKTAGDAASVISRDRAAAVGDRLAPVREIFGEALGAVLPAERNEPLTAAHKAAAAAALTRFAAVLEVIN